MGEQATLFPDTHYNTVGLEGADLEKAKRRAKTQNEIILDLYGKINRMSPRTCRKLASKYGHNWPITSVRRAIYDLTKAKLLRKLPTRVPGDYGMPEHLWEAV